MELITISVPSKTAIGFCVHVAMRESGRIAFNYFYTNYAVNEEEILIIIRSTSVK